MSLFNQERSREARAFSGLSASRRCCDFILERNGPVSFQKRSADATATTAQATSIQRGSCSDIQMISYLKVRQL